VTAIVWSFTALATSRRNALLIVFEVGLGDDDGEVPAADAVEVEDRDASRLRHEHLADLPATVTVVPIIP
jgi:hypothetical protein